MQSFERETVVDAPLDRVWTFHSTVDGLRALTPDWVALRIEEIDRPDPGARNSDILTEGTEIHASVAPFWVLPRQHWVSVIESREEWDDSCVFVDTMDAGPLSGWEHTHRFVAVGDRTRIVDHVEYEPPSNPVARVLVNHGLEPMFAYRHRRTRDILGQA